MNTRKIHISIIALAVSMLLPSILSAQRGTMTIPRGASMSVPQGAVICADTIFANGAGHGTLSLADPSCVCSGSVVIPVEMLVFSAQLREGLVLLSWTTATETHNLGYEVQRHSGEWTTIGFVNGSRTTTEKHSYQFTDRLLDVSPETTTLRYRLRQIDLDGRSRFTPEVEVLLGSSPAPFTLKGYPSPCDEELIIRLSLSQSAESAIRLYDISGRVVMIIAREGMIPAGNHSLLVRTSGLPSGTYLLAVETAQARRTMKVVIRH